MRRWIEAGQLPAFKTPGKHHRIRLKDFQRFLDDHGMPPYPAPPLEVRMLIADDEQDIVDLLVEFLSAEPRQFKLETATDGYEALVKVGGFKPAILIIDVVMPGLDGVKVCQRLKAHPETRTIKILGITGYPDTIPALLEAGADACLPKPLDLRQVKQELESLLALVEA